MKKIAACALLACATAIFYINPASAQGSDATPLPGTVLAGQGTMRFFGLEVYQARLWVSPSFAPERYADHMLTALWWHGGQPFVVYELLSQPSEG